VRLRADGDIATHGALVERAPNVMRLRLAPAAGS